MSEFSQLEEEFDEFIFRPNTPVEWEGVTWAVAIDRLQNELATETNEIDKTTMLRILVKCVIAYDKKTQMMEDFRDEAQRIIASLELSMSDRIKTLSSTLKQETDEIIADIEKNLPSQVKTTLARDAAKARHAPTYELRNRIIDFWREKIGVDISNEIAAELLQKEFPEMSHRTLARYVSEAKKLPPSGTL